MSKQKKPWSKSSPKGPWDYVVIGSGMGGMTTAALLSEIGKRVLVLEQHYVPGGFTHAFKRPGYEWDVGVHAIGEVTSRSITGRLLSRLTKDKLEWVSLGESYDEFYWPDGFRIDFPDNPKEFRRRLVEAFPDEERAIDGYFERCADVAKAMRSYYMSRAMPKSFSRLADPLLTRKARRYFHQTTAEVIGSLTKNEKLATVLTAQWGYYGAVPSESSFAIQALVARHFNWGAYYPVGGAKQIALHMLQTVADAGGWTRIGASVDEVLIRDGKAVGVRLDGGEEILAKHVVSAAGFGATLRRMLPEVHTRSDWVREVLELEPAPAHVCLYLGFEGDIRKAGCGSANKWFYGTWRQDQESWWPVAPGKPIPDADVLYCSFPSLKDPEHDPGPHERHTGEVVTFVPWESFAKWRKEPWKKRGADYEAFKESLKEHLLEQFLGRLPELRPMVKLAEMSTPVTTETFCRPVSGSIYGLEHTPRRFENPWLRPRSPIPGLLFSGSEVTTGGVMGAFMGGVLAAVSAEPIRMLGYLRKDPAW